MWNASKQLGIGFAGKDFNGKYCAVVAQYKPKRNIEHKEQYLINVKRGVFDPSIDCSVGTEKRSVDVCVCCTLNKYLTEESLHETIDFSNFLLHCYYLLLVHVNSWVCKLIYPFPLVNTSRLEYLLGVSNRRGVFCFSSTFLGNLLYFCIQKKGKLRPIHQNSFVCPHIWSVHKGNLT